MVPHGWCPLDGAPWMVPFGDSLVSDQHLTNGANGCAQTHEMARRAVGLQAAKADVVVTFHCQGGNWSKVTIKQVSLLTVILFLFVLCHNRFYRINTANGGPRNDVTLCPSRLNPRADGYYTQLIHRICHHALAGSGGNINKSSYALHFNTTAGYTRLRASAMLVLHAHSCT